MKLVKSEAVFVFSILTLFNKIKYCINFKIKISIKYKYKRNQKSIITIYL